MKRKKWLHIIASTGLWNMIKPEGLEVLAMRKTSFCMLQLYECVTSVLLVLGAIWPLLSPRTVINPISLTYSAIGAEIKLCSSLWERDRYSHIFSVVISTTKIYVLCLLFEISAKQNSHTRGFCAFWSKSFLVAISAFIFSLDVMSLVCIAKLVSRL